jgi:hypothetical protein
MAGPGNHLPLPQWLLPLVGALDLAAKKDLAILRHHKVVRKEALRECRNKRPQGWKQKHPGTGSPGEAQERVHLCTPS